jgi:hypothetical protein
VPDSVTPNAFEILALFWSDGNWKPRGETENYQRLADYIAVGMIDVRQESYPALDLDDDPADPAERLIFRQARDRGGIAHQELKYTAHSWLEADRL